MELLTIPMDGRLDRWLDIVFFLGGGNGDYPTDHGGSNVEIGLTYTWLYERVEMKVSQ